jgi:uncharacterized protein YpmS
MEQKNEMYSKVPGTSLMTSSNQEWWLISFILFCFKLVWRYGFYSYESIQVQICSVYLQNKNNIWSHATITISTRRTELLPIADVQLNDVGQENQEFGIKVHDVCFQDDGY